MWDQNLSLLVGGMIFKPVANGVNWLYDEFILSSREKRGERLTVPLQQPREMLLNRWPSNYWKIKDRMKQWKYCRRLGCGIVVAKFSAGGWKMDDEYPVVNKRAIWRSSFFLRFLLRQMHEEKLPLSSLLEPTTMRRIAMPCSIICFCLLFLKIFSRSLNKQASFAQLLNKSEKLLQRSWNKQHQEKELNNRKTVTQYFFIFLTATSLPSSSLFLILCNYPRVATTYKKR